MTTRYCAWCGEGYESPHRAQKYCSKLCGGKKRYEQHHKTYKKRQYNEHKKYNDVIDEGDNTCKRCGGKTHNRYWCRVCHGYVSDRLNTEFAEGFAGEEGVEED